MKLNKYIWLAAMPMLFAACQNDTLEESLQQQNGIYTLSGKMAGGAAMSRAQVELGNTDAGKESFMWNEGDQFALYQGVEAKVFTISSDYSETGEGDKKSATFTTETPAQANVDYVAVYPAHVRMEGESAKFSFQRDLDFSAATTADEQADVWKEYLKNNMFMIASGQLSATEPNIVSFQHLCTMARITYTNMTDEAQTFNHIRLGSGQQITTDISYNVVNNYQDGGGSTNWYQIQTTGLTVAAGESADFYFMFFPTDFNYDGIFEMALDVEGRGEMYAKIPVAEIAAANPADSRFQAGKRYWFKLTGYKNNVVFSKDFTTDVATIENPELAVALQQLLGSETVTINEDSTATIGLMDARSVEYLNFKSGGFKFSSLDGIEIFSNLKSLNASYTGVKEFDASILPNLEELNLIGNGMTDLNVKGCSRLKWLDIENNQLEELDLSDCPDLYMLNCNHNLLTSLDLSANKRISWLGCQDNLLTELDLTMMETGGDYLLLGGQGESTGDNLTVTIRMTDAWKETWYNLLEDGYNSRRVIIEGEVTPAEDEIMIGNKGFATALYNVLGSDKVTLTESGRAILKKEVAESITELNLNGQTGVTALAGLQYFVNLKRLIADTVGLEGAFDFYTNPALEYLDLSRNPGITNIWVDRNPNLTHLFLVDSPIWNLNVTQNPNLESLLVVDSNIDYLDMSKNPKLYHLNCRANRISKLDVTNNPLLTQLYCGGQHDGITIHVTMTSEHKVWWDESFSTRWENENVEVDVVSMIPESGGSLGNFGTGGEF